MSREKAVSRKRVNSVSSNRRKSNGNSTWEQAMNDYLFWKKAQGVSETTLKGYSINIRHFFTRFNGNWGNNEEIKHSIMKHLADDIKRDKKLGYD
jgi:hypothetical protein